MLPALLAFTLVAGGSQDPLFRCPRLQHVRLRGAADFDLDGLADIYSGQELVLSDGHFGAKGVVSWGGAGFEDEKVADMDGDGYPDLVSADKGGQGLEVRLIDPIALSSTTDFAGGLPAPQCVALGDVDGDGANDAVSAGAAGSYTLLLGDGAGGLTSVQLGFLPGIPRHAELGDLNGDGTPDLVVAVNPGGIKVSLASGGLLPAPATWFPAKAIRAFQLADADADGDLDLAGAGLDFAEVLLGDGSGGFTATGPTPLAHVFSMPQVQALDVDSSGTLDVAVGDGVSCNPASLIVAHGDGLGGIASIEELELFTPGRWFAFGDYDGDADPDLAYGVDFPPFGVGTTCPGFTSYHPHVILAERAGTELLLPQPIAPTATAFALADAVGDARADVVRLTPGLLDVLESDGSGGFDTRASVPVSFAGEEVLVPDLDADGDNDLVAFPGASDPHLLSVHLGQGGGAFAPESLLPFDGIGSRAAFADWTGDGLPDVMAPDRSTDRYLFYPALPGVTFGAPSIFLPLGWDIFLLDLGTIEPVDMDQDGDLDVVTSVDFPEVFSATIHLRILLGNGAGAFVEQPEIFTSSGGPGDTASGDFDLDGWPDVVTNSLQWYRGTGGGALELAASLWSTSEHDEVRAADLTGDGVLDVVANTGTILRGGPDGLQAAGNGDFYFSHFDLDVQLGDLVGDGGVDFVALHPDVGLVALEGRLGCSGSFAAYGGGCIGSNGDAPALYGEGCPTPGGVFELVVARGLPLTQTFASFGLGQGAFPLPNGCKLLLNPWIPIFVGFTLDASGQGSLPIAISPAAAPGITSTAQVGLFDPGASGFFTLSNGLAITVE